MDGRGDSQNHSLVLDFSWFYLGADGGASSSTIIDVTPHQELVAYSDWIDGIIVFGLLVLFLVLTRKRDIRTAFVDV